MNQRIIVFFLFLLSTGLLQSQPIRLHPQNPHYFFYDGEPLVLVTSAEHYGAILNADFDFEKYLQILAEEGMNYTRIFTGSYVDWENSMPSYLTAGRPTGLNCSCQKEGLITSFFHHPQD